MPGVEVLLKGNMDRYYASLIHFSMPRDVSLRFRSVCQMLPLPLNGVSGVKGLHIGIVKALAQ